MGLPKQKKLLAIVGPTGVGKTRIACRMSTHFDAHIISADSRQIFKEMNIGVARPDSRQLNQITHHFIGCRSIFSAYSAGRYVQEALELLSNLFTTSDYQVLCGGSGMYVKALCDGMDDMPAVDHEVRKSIVEEYKKRGLPWLQQQVEKHDPDFFLEVDTQNPRRLMRSLELVRSTGKSSLFFRNKTKIVRPFSVIKIGLTMEREELYHHIDARVDTMMEKGLEEEARALYPFRQEVALQTVGYQELFHYFDGVCTLSDAISSIKKNTRRYAKRQLTWFRKDKAIQWFHPDNWDEILATIQKVQHID